MISRQFVGFRNATVAVLERHEDELQQLGGAMKRLDGAMERVNSRLDLQVAIRR